MNELMLYDPVVAEQERQTDNLIAVINLNHEAVKQAEEIQITVNRCRLAVKAAKTRAARQSAKSKNRARWRRIGREFVMMAVCFASLKAMRLGLIHWNLALPLAAACVIYAAWLAGGVWMEFMEGRKSK